MFKKLRCRTAPRFVADQPLQRRGDERRLQGGRHRFLCRERKKNASWTVKYRRLDRKPGDYRQVVERGFATEADAEAWWAVQKANAHRPAAKAEVIKESPVRLDNFLEGWLKTKRVSIGAGAYRQYESHVREHLIPSLGNLLLVELERNPQLIEDAMAS